MLTAWFVAKIYGKSLQQEHSGNLGARNAGRVLGKEAFILTALGDVGKGVLVVVAGRYLALDERIIGAGVLAVVCGHLYPFWLKGRGGKGVATLLGALLIFSWQATVVFIVTFVVSFAVKHSATISLVVGLIFSSMALISLQQGGMVFVLLAIVLVLWKHRTNIRERMK